MNGCALANLQAIVIRVLDKSSWDRCADEVFDLSKNEALLGPFSFPGSFPVKIMVVM